jgi:hypothetical protein
MSGTAIAISGYTYPTAVSWGYPHLEVFTLSNTQSKTVYTKYRGVNSSNTDWEPKNSSLFLVGGDLAPVDSIAAVSRYAGNIDIFVLGSDNAVYHAATEPWSREGLIGWESRGGTMVTAPSVVSWNKNRLDMLAIGGDSSLWHQWWEPTAGFSTWNRMGGNWTHFVPTVVSWGENRFDVFVVEPGSKELYHTFWNGTWQPPAGFENLGGYCASRPTAVSWTSGRIDVFVRGGDAGLWHLFYDESWSNWTLISGNMSIQAEPEAISWGVNHLDVFAWSTDQSLLHKSLDGERNEWNPREGFERLGGTLSAPPKATNDGVGSIYVFIKSRYGDLQYLHWNETLGEWSPEGAFDSLGTPDQQQKGPILDPIVRPCMGIGDCATNDV